MSESAKILEKSIARRYSPVDKVKVNNQGGGTSIWVEADKAQLDSSDVSENGAYFAANDDLYAYDTVVVNVSTDLADADDVTKATKKITGKDPNLDPNNDYAVGVDNDGNLTKEMIPAAIHIVVPPRKRKYLEGETLDFSGIHVYLMDGNNNRYTDSKYPTGEIPFGELMFPITIAQGGEGGDIYSDGNGINVMFTTFDKYMHNAYGTFYVGSPIGTLNAGEWAGWSEGTIYAACTVNGASAYLTKVETIIQDIPYWDIYGYSDNTNGNFLEVRYNPDTQGGDNAYGSRFVKENWALIHRQSLESGQNALANLPVSDHNPTGTDPNTFYQKTTVKIPVQYVRSDGEILEDEFEIEVGESGTPEPPQPDPWGGAADVSWGGHHYNINRRIVPEVHYANGYLWQEGISTEYNVEQAASMGWLILIR